MRILDLQTLSFISGGDNINNINNSSNSWSFRASQAYQDYAPSKKMLGYIVATLAVMTAGYLIGKEINRVLANYSDPEFI